MPAILIIKEEDYIMSKKTIPELPGNGLTLSLLVAAVGVAAIYFWGGSFLNLVRGGDQKTENSDKLTKSSNSPKINLEESSDSINNLEVLRQKAKQNLPTPNPGSCKDGKFSDSSRKPPKGGDGGDKLCAQITKNMRYIPQM